MKVNWGLEPKSFAEAGRGSLLLAVFGVSHVVRGMKAYWQDNDGGTADFFVTVGPFRSEHGHRPVVYAPEDLGLETVLDETSSASFSPSQSFDDIASQPSKAEEPLGILLADAGRTLMRVGNFGRAGPSQVMYLDLDTGELVGPPAAETALGISRWQIVGAKPDGAPLALFEFGPDSTD